MSNIYILILSILISQSISNPLNLYNYNTELDNINTSSHFIYPDNDCIDGVNGKECHKKSVVSNINSIIDNDLLITNATDKLENDDSIDVSAYNNSNGGLYNLQVIANKSNNLDNDGEYVYIDTLNGKYNGKVINGSVELENLVNLKGKKIKIPIYGTLHDFAYYFVKVYIGTSKQVQWVILDTGSSLFGVTCGNCIQCGKHKNHNYEPYNSSSAIKCADKCKLKGCSGCNFMQRYSEGSFISGEYYTDLISFDKTPEYRVNNIGCILYENKLIYNQLADGIFGMSLYDNSVLSQLFKHSDINNLFSICLSDEGGELIIGGIDPEIFLGNSSEMAWTRLFSSDNYHIYIESMSYLSDNIQITNKKFSIDSGTTTTLLMENMYNSIVNGVLDICFKDREVEGYDLDIGVKIMQKKPHDIVDLIIDREENVTKCEINNNEICSRNIDNFPPLQFTLEGGNILTIKSDTYFFKRDSWWCLGIEKSKDENIFGANFFRNRQLVFTNDKLGFIPSKCKSHNIY